jgi:hypothetical protein
VVADLRDADAGSGFLRTGKTISIGFALVAGNANGAAGSRFRVMTNHLENALSENDSRPLPQDATVIHLPVPRIVLPSCKANGDRANWVLLESSVKTNGFRVRRRR